MSQLAAKIRGEDEDSTSTPSKHDPIQAILAGAGVEYTHLNNEVIGSSKVEEQLSRRAQLADDDMANMQVFAGSQNERVSASSPAFFHINGRPVQFKYHPPKGVMRRQFCSMAQRFGFPNATEFALVVEGMTQAQRRACLERWYRERRQILLGESVKTEVKDEETIKEEQPIKAEEPIKDEAT
jgi:hypothetical protein